MEHEIVPPDFLHFFTSKQPAFAHGCSSPKKMLSWVSWYPNLYWWSCCLSVMAGGRCFARSKHRPLSSTSEKPCAQWVFWCLLRLVFEARFITLARKSLISGIVSYVCMYVWIYIYPRCYVYIYIYVCGRQINANVNSNANVNANVNINCSQCLCQCHAM